MTKEDRPEKIDYGKCHRKDCDAKATHAIRINVPGVGAPIQSSTITPMAMTLGLMCCHEHANSVDPDELLAPAPVNGLPLADKPPPADMRRMFTIAAKGREGFTPDFDRAWITPVALGSPEWQEFVRLTQRAKQGDA